MIYQSRIIRRDLQLNRDVIYLFGDNVRRTGNGGQAGQMRGEPNAAGIVTKWAPATTPDAYFSDNRFDEIVCLIENDFYEPFLHSWRNGLVVIPADGIGTGLSDLPRRAPRVMEHIRSLVRDLVSGNKRTP